MSKLFSASLIAGMGLVASACVKATPTITELPSTIHGLLFNGSTSKDVRITSLVGVIDVSGSCDARVEEWQYSLDGKTWAALSSFAVNGSSLVCENRSMQLLLSPDSFGFTNSLGQGQSENKTLFIRGKTNFGNTLETLVNVTYAVPMGTPVLTGRFISSGGAIQKAGGGGASPVVFRASLAGQTNEVSLKDGGGNQIIHITREK